MQYINLISFNFGIQHLSNSEQHFIFYKKSKVQSLKAKYQFNKEVSLFQGIPRLYLLNKSQNILLFLHHWQFLMQLGSRKANFSIIINIVKMFDYDDSEDSQRFQLDYLLNYSRISESHRDIGSSQCSMLRDKLNLSQKERTRQQSYEDIMKQLTQTKLERIDLARQMEALKAQIYAVHLMQFQRELQELDEQNRKLRFEMIKIQRKNDDKSERYSNRSSIKPKTLKSNYGDENKKTSAKPNRNRASPNMLLMKKQAKLVESTTNLGRSQIQSPRCHKRRESQLTERKIEDNGSIGISINVSVMDDRVDQFNIRQSFSKHTLQPQGRNAFISILEQLLQQQKDDQFQRCGQLNAYLSSKPINPPQNINFVNDLEIQVKQAGEKLQILSLVLSKYQRQMGQLNINLRSVEEWTCKLWQVKGKFMQMQQKCDQIPSLRDQLERKQQALAKMTAQQQSNSDNSIPALETMIKLLSTTHKNFDNSKLYMSYCKQLKQLFKFDKEDQTKRQNKMLKVKQTVDSIRQGRKKFNELIAIYQGRIVKLQQKIGRVRSANQRK